MNSLLVIESVIVTSTGSTTISVNKVIRELAFVVNAIRMIVFSSTLEKYQNVTLSITKSDSEDPMRRTTIRNFNPDYVFSQILGLLPDYNTPKSIVMYFHNDEYVHNMASTSADISEEDFLVEYSKRLSSPYLPDTFHKPSFDNSMRTQILQFITGYSKPQMGDNIIQRYECYIYSNKCF